MPRPVGRPHAARRRGLTSSWRCTHRCSLRCAGMPTGGDDALRPIRPQAGRHCMPGGREAWRTSGETAGAPGPRARPGSPSHRRRHRCTPPRTATPPPAPLSRWCVRVRVRRIVCVGTRKAPAGTSANARSHVAGLSVFSAARSGRPRPAAITISSTLSDNPPAPPRTRVGACVYMYIIYHAHANRGPSI
jgi:hypothetical protein